jgi:hypothetical protein
LNGTNNLVAKGVLLWLIPLAFVLLAFLLIDVVQNFPHLRNIRLDTLLTVELFTLTTSALWAIFGFIFVLVFGGLFVTDILSGISKVKLITKGLVITTKAELEKVAKSKPRINLDIKLFLKIFGITAALNFLYVIFLLRYLSTNTTNSAQNEIGVLSVAVSSIIERGQGGQLFFIIALIISVIVLPLLSFTVPFLDGSIKVRQVDNRLFHWYGLSLIFSITGGVSLGFFLLSIAQISSKGALLFDASVLLFVAFVFAAISWYSAIGMNFALPFAQKYLATLLLKLDGKKSIYFGHVWVGETPQEAKQV